MISRHKICGVGSHQNSNREVTCNEWHSDERQKSANAMRRVQTKRKGKERKGKESKEKEKEKEKKEEEEKKTCAIRVRMLLRPR